MSSLSVALKRFSSETFTSFQVRNYRLYYIGRSSHLRHLHAGIAQAWLVLNISNSGTALGIVSALRYLHPAVRHLGGVVAFFNKRTVLYIPNRLPGSGIGSGRVGGADVVQLRLLVYMCRQLSFRLNRISPPTWRACFWRAYLYQRTLLCLTILYIKRARFTKHPR
jgi:hypothetical protein